MGTQDYAEPVAAALGANTPALPVASAAAAAVNAAVAVLNGAVAAPAIVLAINAGGGVWHAGPGGWGGAATGTANATIAVDNGGAPGNLDARCTAAAVSFGVSATLVRTAVEPLAQLTVRAGRPPFAPGERYVLLNADADFHVVPTLAPRNAAPTLPVIVGMTAMHHGSYLEDNAFLEALRIPWAPGSAEAGLPANVQPAHSTAQAVVDVSNAIGGVAINKVDIAHAGAAAAAAIYAAHAHNANNAAVALVGGDCRAYAQCAAAAVVSTLNGPIEAGEIALAATLGTVTRVGFGNGYNFAQAAHDALPAVRALAFAQARLAVIMGASAGEAHELGNPAVLLVAGAMPGGAAANTQTIAELVAALVSVTCPGVAAAAVARASLRALRAIQAGGNHAAAVAANRAPNATNVHLGVAALPAQLSAPQAGTVADAAIALWPAAGATAGAVAAAAAVHAAVPGAGITADVPILARPLAASLRLAGVPAVDAHLAALRAVIARETGAADVAAIVVEINALVGFVNGVAIAVLNAPLTAAQARAAAEATIDLTKLGAARNGARYRLRAKAAALATNRILARSIEDAVAVHRPELATDMVSRPGLGMVARPAAVVTGANVEADALAIGAYEPDGFDRPAIPVGNVRPVGARLARAGCVGAAAGGNVDDEITAITGDLGIGLGGLDVHVRAIMAIPPGTAWPGFSLPRAAREAALLAMVGEAERRSGNAGATILAAIEALTSATVTAAAAAAAVNMGAGPAPIAYSYGVHTGTTKHCYLAPLLGNLGHPHPLAVAEYVAKGWTTRRNTSADAGHGGAQTDASPIGHVAIAWDHVADTNVVAQQVVGHPVCATCGLNVNVQE